MTLSVKDWQNLRRRRLVGPKLAGIEVPCTECGAFFVRDRGTRSVCSGCSRKITNAKHYAKRTAKEQTEAAEDATGEWIKDEIVYHSQLDRFQAATYEHRIREAVERQRDEEREQASRYTGTLDEREKAKLDDTYALADGFVVEKPLDHALSPDGPDEGYSTYFLPRTEGGYLEADVDWDWRTEEAARWWRENPHAFASLRQ